MPTTSAPAPSQTAPLSPAQHGRHLIYCLVTRVHRASDATLVGALIAGTGAVALGGWLVTLAHGDTVYWTAMMAGLLWCAVMGGAVVSRNCPPPTPPAAPRSTRPALDRGTYRIGFSGVIDELGRELAMLHRHRRRDIALIAQWTALRDQAWSADRRGQRAARETVVARWNQARAAHPEMFAPRIAPWLRHRQAPIASVAILAEERADGRYITYPTQQRLRGLRGARAEITGRALMVTTEVIVAIGAPFLAWAALDATWQQTTTGQIIPAHLDAALGGIVWVAGVIAAVIIIAAIAVPAGWYVVADTARRRRLAGAISTAVLVELVGLAAALVAAVVVLTVMVAS